MPYSGNVSSYTNSSVLSLKGTADEMGTYTCHWNNSLGEIMLKSFIVTYVFNKESVSPETIIVRDTRIAIGVSVPLVILLLISIAVGVRFYLSKVKKKFIKSNQPALINQ